MTRGLSVCLASSVLCAATAATAQTQPAPSAEGEARLTPHASLVVTRSEGAESCPDASALAEQVHRVAGASVVTASTALSTPADTWIQVAISRNFVGYRAELSAGGLHRGARTLEDLGPGCASLADAITITIAMFLDPYSAPAAPPPVPTPAEPPRPARTLRRAEPGPRVTIELAPGVAIGLLEHTQPIFTGRIAWVATDRWSFALGGTFVFPDAVPDGAHEVDLHLSYAALTGCVRTLGNARAARLDWCAAQLFGSLSGSGQHYASNSAQHVLWAAIASGPEMVLPFTPSLAWTLTGLGVLPLVFQGFDTESNGTRRTVFSSAAAAGLVTVGVRGAVSKPADFAVFEQAYRDHFAFTWRALRRLGVPERDLGDATQDVFVVVYRKLGEFDFARPMSSWIYAICLRIASDRRRSAASRNEILADANEPSEPLEASVSNDAEQSRHAERRALLDAALDAMSLEQRAVFTLFELEGRTGEEVAGMLAVPAATVHSRLRLAREVFRRVVELGRARERFERRRMGGEQ